MIEQINTDDQKMTVETRRKEFTEYFIDEFEGKLKWYSSILEDKTEDGSLFVKDGISAITDALTGSPKGVADLISSKLVSYFEDKKNKTQANHLSSLAYDFKNKETQQNIRKILVEGCFDIFQSFEMIFMTITAKIGGEPRAMQKLAEQSAHNVLDYYKNLKEKCDLTPEIVTKGTIYDFTNSTLPSGRHVHENDVKLNTAKLFHKTGIVVIKNKDKQRKEYYMSNITKTVKYGYRRLFSFELDQKNKILSSYKQEPNQNKTYDYVLNPETIKEDSILMLKYLNDKDPNLHEQRIAERFDSLSKDLIRELTNEMFHDLTVAIGSMESVMKDMITKQGENSKTEKETQPTIHTKYNFSNNKVNNMKANFY